MSNLLVILILCVTFKGAPSDSIEEYGEYLNGSLIKIGEAINTLQPRCLIAGQIL